MLLLANLRMAFKALWANRLRTALTMLGIIVGVASVVLLIAYSAGVEHEMLSRFDRRGATTLTMGIAFWDDDVPSTEFVELADSQAVRESCWTVESVALVDASRRDTLKYFDRERADCDIIGAEADIFKTRPTEFAYGRPYTVEEDFSLQMVCVLGGVVARELFFQEDAIGKTVLYSGRPLQVVGVLAEQGGRAWESTDNHVLIPFNTLQAYFSGEYYGGDLVMKIRQFELMPYAETQVREQLLARHPRLVMVVEEEEIPGRRRRRWGTSENGIWAWSSYEWRE